MARPDRAGRLALRPGGAVRAVLGSVATAPIRTAKNRTVPSTSANARAAPMTSNTSGDIVCLLASTLRPPECRRVREIPACGGPRPRRGCGHRGRTPQQQGDRRRADRRGGDAPQHRPVGAAGAKALMLVQALASLLTVALVAARAVNILATLPAG